MREDEIGRVGGLEKLRESFVKKIDKKEKKCLKRKEM